MGTPPELTVNEDLIQQILNYEFDLGLSKNIRIANSSGSKQVDFIDKDRKAAAEIKGVYNANIRGAIVTQIKIARSLLRQYFQQKYRFILVVLVELNDNDRGFLQSELETNSEVDQNIFDLKDLQRMAQRHGLSEELILSSNLDTKTSNLNVNIKAGSKVTAELTGLNFIDSFIEFADKTDINFFLIQSTINEVDHSIEWQRNSKWKLLSKAPYLVSQDDILFMCSHNDVGNTNSLKITAIGWVQNSLENNEFVVDWADLEDISMLHGLDIIEKVESKIVLRELLLMIINYYPTIISKLQNRITERIKSNKTKPEIYLDDDFKFTIGLEVGEEIKDYDVIFLPKSSYGGVGQNGIASHILEILGVERSSIAFNTIDLEQNQFKWSFIYINHKRYDLCFVVSKDINKDAFNFKDNLERAILNFPRKPSDEDFPDNLKIFMPMLGTGQAKMPLTESFKYILESLSLFPNTFINYTIRFNFPIELSKNKLLKYIYQIEYTLKFELEKDIDFELERLYGNQIEAENNSLKNAKNKIPFHLDQVVNEDKLGREPVAKEFVRLIKSDIFTDKLNHSFMVHLQGKWGAGKSSFLNFIKKNLNSDEEKWIIVEYNAWQNQHIKPPWWSFIDQVYLQSRHQMYLIGIRVSWYFRCKELFRRVWRYSGWDKITAFIVFLLSVLCITYFGDDILDIFSKTTVADQNKSFASNFGDFFKLVLTLVSIVSTLFAFAKFITVPFFINSSKEAKSFVLRASDPMNKIKDHFNKLVDDINSKKKKRQLAIFIDDIDRCDKEFIVQLLEGIQTLFKDKRVLYIVAGDKNWISTSFGNTYEDFATKQVDKQQLGEFFIEKAFQLSFRLPNISEESKQNYWNHILGMENGEKDKKINSIEELTEDEQYELKADLKESKSELTNPKYVSGLQEKYNLSGDTASNIVIEEKNKDTEELKHLLQEYHKYIDTNPRSIVRLANNYTMARSILMAERVTFNEHKLFRWLVIEDLCPKVKTIVPHSEILSDFEKIIAENKDIIKRNKCLDLISGSSEFMEGKITIEEIKTIKGF